MYPKAFGKRAAARIGLGAALLVLMLPPWALAHDPADLTRFEAAPLRSVPAQSSRDTHVTLGLKVVDVDSGIPILDLRGDRIVSEKPRPFSVEVTDVRFPCAGEYRLVASQEYSGNGNSAVYTALLKLLAPEADRVAIRCGVSPPPRPGTLRVSLGVVEKEFFYLHAKRANGGPFMGTLNFPNFAQCNRGYELESRLELGSWNRDFNFKVKVIEVDATLQGKTIKHERC